MSTTPRNEDERLESLGAPSLGAPEEAAEAVSASGVSTGPHMNAIAAAATDVNNPTTTMAAVPPEDATGTVDDEEDPGRLHEEETEEATDAQEKEGKTEAEEEEVKTRQAEGNTVKMEEGKTIFNIEEEEEQQQPEENEEEEEEGETEPQPPEEKEEEDETVNVEAENTKAKAVENEEEDERAEEKDEQQQQQQTLSEYIAESVIQPLLDPDLEVAQKLQTIDTQIQPYLEEIDGYWSFSSAKNDSNTTSTTTIPTTTTEGHLPSLDWERHFRNAYTVLLWIRPQLSTTTEHPPTTLADEEHNNPKTKHPRILYRFANHPDDAHSTTGVCVTMGEWRAVEDQEDNDDDEDEDEEPRPKKKKEEPATQEEATTTRMQQPPQQKRKKKHKKKTRKVITTFTAYSLPYVPVDLEAMMFQQEHEDANSAASNPAPTITVPVELIENEWSFVGITHVNPYLKCPQWSLCINGKTIASGELWYPHCAPENRTTTGRGGGGRNTNSSVLNYNTLFRNVTAGGCAMLRRTQTGQDCAQNASALQAAQQLEQEGAVPLPRYPLAFHVASFCVAANEVFTPTIQALLAQAGPTMTVQAQGRVPQLPPVANWSKGSSLEGPNVGIPLVVHGQSLRLQQLSSACRVYGTALESQLRYGQPAPRSSQDPPQQPQLPQLPQHQQHIVCRMPRPRGTTHSAPRVGLIQPTPPIAASNSPQKQHYTGIRGSLGVGWGVDIIDDPTAATLTTTDHEDEEPIALTIIGPGCSIHHTISNYLLTNDVGTVDGGVLHATTTKHFSLILLHNQQFDTSCCILPFFLSLPPPGTMHELQFDTLLTQSLQHIFDVFTNAAKYGAALLQLLSTSIRSSGGGRWHEELLQNGTLHVLGSAVRQALVRAEYLHVADYATYPDFIKGQATVAAAAAAAAAMTSSMLHPTKLDTNGQRSIHKSNSRDSNDSSKDDSLHNSTHHRQHGISSNTMKNNVNPMTVPMSLLPISPTNIPLSIVYAMIDLLDSCCGPPLSEATATAATAGPLSSHDYMLCQRNTNTTNTTQYGYVEDLDPSVQIQRTSDLALSAVFGMAFDVDLWGGDIRALALMWYELSIRYGGICITSGYIIRSQISVQYFLDIIKSTTRNHNRKKHTNNNVKQRGSNGDDNKSIDDDSIMIDSNIEVAEDDNEEEELQRQKYLRSISISCGEILKSMLLSSLSNGRSISQGEHDVGACLGALSDCPLGSLVSHVVFYALIGILEWCEIVPPNFLNGINRPTAAVPNEKYGNDDDSENGSDGGDVDSSRKRAVSMGSTTSSSSSRHRRHSSSHRIDDDHKCQVASRLARNLMMGQYHDVISPMLLSRTIFAGYNFPSSSTTINAFSSADAKIDDNHDNDGDSSLLPLSWEEDWRLSLTIFVWVSSIGGKDGIHVSKSLGSLLLASGLAGSLHSVLEHIVDSSSYLQNLFVPDPTMALTVVAHPSKMQGGSSSSLSDGWSYTDLLTDRLSVMIPIIPSLVISLFNNTSASGIYTVTGNSDISHKSTIVSEHSVRVLTELTTAIGGSFYRVYGGITHSSVGPSSLFRDFGRSVVAQQQVIDSIETAIAKSYVPHLLAVIMILENEMIKMNRFVLQKKQFVRPDASTTTSDDDDVTTLCSPELVVEHEIGKETTNDGGAWVDVPSSSSINKNASTFSDSFAVLMPPPPSIPSEGKGRRRRRDEHTNESLSSIIKLCQQSLLTTVSELMYNAMEVDGGEASTILWRNILATLKEVESYARFADSNADNNTIDDNYESHESAETKIPKNEDVSITEKECLNSISKNVLCRLLSMVLVKCLKRDYSWELWSVPLSAAISRLCLLIEERELLLFPLGTTSTNTTAETNTNNCSRSYSTDQIILMCTLQNVLEYGRCTTGWCQLILPTPPTVTSINNNNESNDRTNKFRGFLKLGLRGSSHGERCVSPITRAETPLSSKATKVMLPILQPTLRAMLECLGSCNLRSGISIYISKKNNTTATKSSTNLSSNIIEFKNIENEESDDQQRQLLDAMSDSTAIVDLLEYFVKELRHSLMAAIVGLAFATARDIALHAMATLRRSINSYQSLNDDKGVELCSSLLCMTAEEIRVRYEGEHRRRETALIDAYHHNDESLVETCEAAAAAASSSAVENMMLGDALVPTVASSEDANDIAHNNFTKQAMFDEQDTAKNGGGGQDEIEDGGGTLVNAATSTAATADFLLFPEGFKDGDEGLSLSSKINSAKMEWSKYDGLCTALEKCLTKGGEGCGNCCDDDTKKPIDHESKDAQHSAKIFITTLEPFLDAWDNYAAFDAVDTELVKLFDFQLNLSIPASSSNVDGEVSTLIPELELFCLQGSGETAADAMSTFIELAAAEKSRLMEVNGMFLPNHRNSCISFTDRFCWSRYMDILRKNKNTGLIDDLWERGISDGNRDVRSRLVSIPCSPQFKRFIPKYLDHSADTESLSTAKPSNEYVNETDDIDAFTSLLIQSGHLEIVDITKKEINEEEQPQLDLTTAILDDDFDDSPLEISTLRSDDNTDGAASSKKKVEREWDNKIKGATGESTTTTSTDENDLFSNDETDESESFDKTKIGGSSQFNITASAFACPPDNSSSTLGLMHSAAAGLIERHLENCLHVKTEGSRKCSMLLTSTHLILEYDVDCDGLYEGELMAVHEEAERQRMIEESARVGCGGVLDEEKIRNDIERRQKMTAALRPKSIRWNLSELSHVYLRRYRLRDSAIELFFIPSGGTSFGGYGLYSPSTSLFIDFGPGYEGNSRRDGAAFAVMKRAPPQAIKQWPDRAAQFSHEQLSRLTIGWVEGRITNFDYLLHLNMLAGRSYNDTCQYPIMPWVLSNYHSEKIPDLTDPANFRDLTKPMGALNPNRLEDFIERFNTFADPTIPPFMYGSHYSTNAGVVLHFLVRLHPFAGLHRQLQGGHFDVADRLFASVARTWEMCTGSSAAEVKELTPEWYCNPTFLKNTNKFKLGTSQDGEVIDDVTLPPWAKDSPEQFIEVMRNALESDVCSAMLPDWIDLVFGRKQQGPEAIAAHNVFFYLTYYGSVDVAAIEDEGLREATELQIAHFGQCPMQLFVRPHVRRVQYVNKKRLSFYQITSAYTFGIDRGAAIVDDGDSSNVDPRSVIFGQPLYLPFFSAPLSHWVHLDAPPPGPHAPLISVRLAGTDRCLAVDARGVFHCFRWVWKAEESTEISGFGCDTTFPLDNGCFIAQRELTRFRSVPRLIYKPQRDEFPAVVISKTLFAGRSVLLVLSDGDGRGGLAMQLVDPAKGLVRGEAVIKSIHSSRIQCIATDPIGTAAGHGGVGGELAIVGSLDGTASIWRFMSSHYLPLRPRVRLSGHCSSPIYAVGLSAAINIAVTVSQNRLCLHSIGNGTIIRIIEPPTDTLELPDGIEMATTFAKSPAVAISVQGFVVVVCATKLKTNTRRSVITLHLFSLEGVSLGSKALESWRGIPHKIVATPDGTTILVCAGRGVTVHRLSAVSPLEFIDEWQVTESEDLSSNNSHAFDVDLGPSLNRPVVAAAACSNGVLRLHGLAGISAFSERHNKVGISQSVGSLIAAPARRFKNVFGRASATANKAAGVGKDISKEITSNVKERGVTGFLGGMFGKK